MGRRELAAADLPEAQLAQVINVLKEISRYSPSCGVRGGLVHIVPLSNGGTLVCGCFFSQVTIQDGPLLQGECGGRQSDQPLCAEDSSFELDSLACGGLPSGGRECGACCSTGWMFECIALDKFSWWSG